MDINSIFLSDTKYTFLIGAGISIDPPSNLLAAHEIAELLVERTVPSEYVEKISKLESLRYELIVELIQNSFDPELKFLDYYELVLPNLNHYFLANAIIKQYFVMTTNNDYLIEYSLKEIHPNSEDISLVITKQDFNEKKDPYALYNVNKLPIYKLHGSKKNYFAGQNTSDSLITTIASFGRDRPTGMTFSLETYKKPVFKNLTENRTLVVMGYSGRDEFDISPTLRDLPNLERFIWIKHTPSKKIKIKKLDIQEESVDTKLDSTEKLLFDIAKKASFEVFLIKTDTGNLIKSVLWPKLLENIPIPHIEITSKTTQTFKEWIFSSIEVKDVFQQYHFAVSIFLWLNMRDLALEAAHKGLEIAEEQENKSQRGNFLRIIANHYHYVGDWEKSLEFYNQALEIAKELQENGSHASILISIGSIYKTKGSLKDQKIATEKLFNAIEIADQNDLKSIKSTALNTLGGLYADTRDWETALDYYKESYQIVEELGIIRSKASCLNNIGYVYHYQRKYKKALENYNEALKVYQGLGLLNDIATTINNIGNTRFALGEYKEALENFKEAIKIADELDNKIAKSTYINNIALIYGRKGKWEKALKYFEESLSIAEKYDLLYGSQITITNIAQLLLQNIRYYSKKEDHEKVEDFLRKVKDIALKRGDLEGYAKALINIWRLKNKDYWSIRFGIDGNDELEFENINYILGFLKDPLEIADFYLLISQSYIDNSDYKEALEYSQKALEIYKEYPNSIGYGNTLLKMISIYNRKGKKKNIDKYVELALIYFQKAYKMVKAEQDFEKESSILYSLGSIYEFLDDLVEAEQYYEQALKILKKHKFFHSTMAENIKYSLDYIRQKKRNKILIAVLANSPYLIFGIILSFKIFFLFVIGIIFGFGIVNTIIGAIYGKIKKKKRRTIQYTSKYNWIPAIITYTGLILLIIYFYSI